MTKTTDKFRIANLYYSLGKFRGLPIYQSNKRLQELVDELESEIDTLMDEKRGKNMERYSATKDPFYDLPASRR